MEFWPALEAMDLILPHSDGLPSRSHSNSPPLCHFAYVFPAPILPNMPLLLLREIRNLIHFTTLASMPILLFVKSHSIKILHSPLQFYLFISFAKHAMLLPIIEFQWIWSIFPNMALCIPNSTLKTDYQNEYNRIFRLYSDSKRKTKIILQPCKQKKYENNRISANNILQDLHYATA